MSARLSQDDTSKILAALREIEANNSLAAVDGSTPLDQLKSLDADGWIKDVETVMNLMKAYQPRGEDGSPHEEMSGVLAQFLKSGEDHKGALIREKARIEIARTKIEARPGQTQATRQAAEVVQEA